MNLIRLFRNKGVKGFKKKEKLITNHLPMKLLIFKTNISTKQTVETLKALFRHYLLIFDWSIDMEDADRVLRIEATEDLREKEIIQLVRDFGVRCEVLPD